MTDIPAVLTSPADGLLCRGAWRLGSACGRCQRCLETAKPAIESLRKELADAERRLLNILMLVPRSATGHDLSMTFKAQCFDEIRRIAYDDVAGGRLADD